MLSKKDIFLVNLQKLNVVYKRYNILFKEVPPPTTPKICTVSAMTDSLD